MTNIDGVAGQIASQAFSSTTRSLATSLEVSIGE
jgi:hypothetical protein